MNFQDQIQQIFGTTDIHELKQISRDADNYRCLKADMNNSSISEKKSAGSADGLFATNGICISGIADSGYQCQP